MTKTSRAQRLALGSVHPANPTQGAPGGHDRRGGDRRRWNRPTSTSSNNHDQNAEMDRLRRAIVGSTVEASRALLMAQEQENAVLRAKAVNAYGEANGLDRAMGPSRRVAV